MRNETPITVGIGLIDEKARKESKTIISGEGSQDH